MRFMDILRGLYNSFSGGRESDQEEVAGEHVTGRTGRRGGRQALSARPEETPENIPLEQPVESAFGVGTQGEQSPVDAFDISGERRSLDSLSTNLFCPTNTHSTPGKETPSLGPQGNEGAGVGRGPTLDPNTPPFTDVSSGTPATGAPSDTGLVTGRVGATGPTTGQASAEQPSNLPLDGSLLRDLHPVGPTPEQQLETANHELSQILLTKDKFLREVEKDQLMLDRLHKDVQAHKTGIEKLVHQRVDGEQEVADLEAMKVELEKQVRSAKNELEGIRSSYQKVAKDVEKLSTKVPVPPVQDPRLPATVAHATVTVPTVATAGTNEVPPSSTGGSFVNAQHSNTSYANVYYPARSMNYNANTSGSSSQQMLASVPVPKPRARQGFTPAQKAKYERNPAIEQMGLDIVPRDIDGEDSPPLDFGEVRHPDAARQKAIDVPKFTGSPPWRKYIRRFKGIMESNRWNNQQALVSLKQALFGGPGERALVAFEQLEVQTLDSLIETAQWAVRKIGEHDPRTQLLRRVQLKDEHLRTYGFDLQELIAECYQGCRPDTPTVVQELTSRFVMGVRDSDLQAYLREKWTPVLSLADLFDYADVYDTRQAVFPGLGAAATSAIGPREVPMTKKETEPKGNKPSTSKKVAAVTSEADIEKMFVAYMQKHTDKAKGSSGTSSKKAKNKKKPAPAPCRRCQKMGHWASECTAPAPVAPKKETEN